MGITIEKARKKHGLDEYESLKKTLKVMNNEKKVKELREQGLIPRNAYGAMVPKAGHLILIAKEFQPDQIMGNVMNPDPRHEMKSANHTLELFKDFNIGLKHKRKQISEDPELNAKTKTKLCAELDKHAEDLGVIMEDITHKRLKQVKSKQDLMFDHTLENLEKTQLSGEFEPRLVKHAKRLYEIDPWRFLALENEIGLRAESIDGALNKEYDQNLMAAELKKLSNLNSNVHMMFTNDKIINFLHEERNEEMKKWDIEPFPEAEEKRKEGTQLLKEKRAELKKAGIEEKEIVDELAKLHEKLESNIMDHLKKKLDKEKKAFVYAGIKTQEILKMPIHKVEDINRVQPAIIFGDVPKKLKRQQSRFDI